MTNGEAPGDRKSEYTVTRVMGSEEGRREQQHWAEWIESRPNIPKVTEVYPVWFVGRGAIANN